MKPKDGKTTAAWVAARVSPPSYPPIRSDAQCDVCVVGAGIAGLTSAYLLAREGLKVIVVDYGPVADGQSGRTSAHLTSAIDDRFYHLIDEYDEQTARICYESHASAIDAIEQLQAREQIDCDFARLDGYLVLGEDDDPAKLDRELAAAQLIGIDGVELLDRAPTKGFEGGRCLRFPRQGRFHPLKYLAGLCNALEKLGVTIHCGTRITEASGGDFEKGELCEAKSDLGPTVRSRAVVVATNAPGPIGDWQGIYTKQAAYRTYMLGLEISKGSVADALWWDTLDPYHYVRVDTSSGDGSHDTLLVGGDDHKVGHFGDGSGAPFAKLEQWTRKHFPAATTVKWRWSGQVQEPADGIAFIGRAPTNKPNVYVITGDSGQGLTHGTLGAILVRDLITGRQCAWEPVYDPSRKVTGAIGEFIKENVSAVKTFKEYVTPGEVSSLDEIRPGSGAVMREGLKKLAVFRDDAGAVHKCSAICTHMGCIVRWNHVEQSWDCPCHGSRFDPLGKVLVSPAVSDLPAAEE